MDRVSNGFLSKYKTSMIWIVFDGKACYYMDEMIRRYKYLNAEVETGIIVCH